MPQKTSITLRMGFAPKELGELTLIELSFISPSHIHGNIFTYDGGPKGIQG
jgi:hypothetical protein